MAQTLTLQTVGPNKDIPSPKHRDAGSKRPDAHSDSDHNPLNRCPDEEDTASNDRTRTTTEDAGDPNDPTLTAAHDAKKEPP